MPEREGTEATSIDTWLESEKEWGGGLSFDGLNAREFEADNL